MVLLIQNISIVSWQKLTNKASTYSSLTNWNANYPTDYTNDLSVKDYLEKTIKERVDMYNPMYYLHSYYAGYKSSDVATFLESILELLKEIPLLL